jgi:hypothetical protein
MRKIVPQAKKSDHSASIWRQWQFEHPEITHSRYHCMILKKGGRGELSLVFDDTGLISILVPEHERINDPPFPQDRWGYQIHLYVKELLLYPVLYSQLNKIT